MTPTTLYHLFVSSSNDFIVSNESYIKDYTRVYSTYASSWDSAYYQMVTVQKNPLYPYGIVIQQ